MEPADSLAALVDDPAAFLDAPEPSLRRLAVSCCAGLVDTDPVVFEVVAGLARTDPAEEVRAEAVEILAGGGRRALPGIRAAAEDESDRVVEAVATALGEVPDPESLGWLIGVATGDRDKLVRQAAVASLGAIGDERAVPVLIDLAGAAPPQVRRRAIVALSVFDGPEVEGAIRAALDDRNPMVREAAEMVAGT